MGDNMIKTLISLMSMRMYFARIDMKAMMK